MGQAYQDEVGDSLDYHLQSTPYGFRARGPLSFDDESLKNSVSFIGAAQAFGVWCEFPFPKLVANALSLNCLNLGHGGAGPRAFLLNPRVIDDINKTKACVIQVMSGRSVGNRYMKQHDGTCVVTLQHPSLPPEKLLAHSAWAKLFPILSEDERQMLAEESVNTFLEEYKELRDRLAVPLILLWVSTRLPSYNRTYDNCREMLGEFPHLIDIDTWESLCNLFEHRVMACSKDFINRPLWSQKKRETFAVTRSWGMIDSFDASYTHPYLHVLAAQKLLDKIHEIDIFQ
ncbi:hypothetical protein KBY93_14335 [Synechococcus sp. J7-Johnson]|uniref:DUF6473 family protein n=1 Tax=Synechococcus sp. J7-Johnson TaxID=2823737 RepID=UPI0020CE0D04|nr:DUF6473 family protein [Synechococcus sp. J7-Johnson]MCP9841801.1 hypothetical protein [Synechococcus sp. J7-Johnson]